MSFRLCTFGSVALESDGTPAGGAATGRVPLALLSILARAGRRGESRDRLIALLWPESDSERARNSLRQTLFVLRQGLGKDVVTGSEDLRLDAGVITSDVGEFMEAADRVDHKTALRLYRGPFLEGFFLRSSRSFEEWLTAQREEFAGVYCRILEEAADSAEAEGDRARALELLQKRVAADRLNSRTTLRFMRALATSGDRTGAIRVGTTHRRLAIAELGCDADPEIEALLETLQSPDAGTVAVVRSTEAGTPLAAAGIAGDNGEPDPESDRNQAALPTGDVATGGGDRNRVEILTRTRRWVAAAVALAAGATAAFVVFSNPRPGALDDARILVASFENRTGDPDLDVLGEVAQDWVTKGLQEAGLANVVDPLSALLAVRDVRDRTRDYDNLARAAAIADVVAARIVVWGAIYRSSDSLQFQAFITDVHDRRVLATLDPVWSLASDPLAGADLLRNRVAGAVASLLDPRLASISAPSSRPPTLDAYHEFINGLLEFQAGRNSKSLPHFEVAARLDTTFALPLIWSVFATQNHPQARDSLIAILQLRRAGLSPLDRYATDYFVALRDGDTHGRVTAAREAARLSPGSNWSHNAAYASLDLNRPREALDYLEQIHPEGGWVREWVGYWMAMAHATHNLGLYQKELESAVRYRRVVPQDQTAAAFKAKALIALGRTVEAERIIDDMLGLPPRIVTVELLHALALEAGAHGHDDLADQLMQRAIGWSSSPAATDWIAAHSDPAYAENEVAAYKGMALYHAGRPAEARAALEPLVGHPQWWGVFAEFYLGLLAAEEGDRPRALEAVARMVDSGRFASAGAISAKLGDDELALQFAERCMRERCPEIGNFHREPVWQRFQHDPKFLAITRPRG